MATKIIIIKKNMQRDHVLPKRTISTKNILHDIFFNSSRTVAQISYLHSVHSFKIHLLLNMTEIRSDKIDPLEAMTTSKK